MLDASLLGIGRGAGNCPLELLMSFLRNPKFKLQPIIDVIQKQLIPLQKKIDWGYHIPYLITEAMNEHPRSAMKWMVSDQKNQYVDFYNKMLEEANV